MRDNEEHVPLAEGDMMLVFLPGWSVMMLGILYWKDVIDITFPQALIPYPVFWGMFFIYCLVKKSTGGRMKMGNHPRCGTNCGGTGCPGPLVVTVPLVVTSTPSCKHSNGVFIDVNTWLSTKTIFYCLDCSQQMSKKDRENE